MCRLMSEILKEVYPEMDYSRYKVKYSPEKNIPAEVQAAFNALWQEYLTLQEKMTPEQFKASVIAWASEAFIHYSAYR